MPIAESVTLIIYSWKSVEPGTLSWVFPSVAAAVHAARTMTNALEWAVIAGNPFRAGRNDVTLAKVRADGQVLLEETLPVTA